MSHGSHWEPIVEMSDKNIRKYISLILAAGQPVESKDAVKEAKYIHLRYGGSGLAGIATLARGEKNLCLATGYPMGEIAATTELEIYSLDPIKDEDDDDWERDIHGITADGKSVFFFSLLYPYYQAQLEKGGRFAFALSAIAYSLAKSPDYIEISEGEFFESVKKERQEEDPDFDPATFTSLQIDMTQLRCYLPRDYADFEFQSIVEEVIPFSLFEVGGYALRLNLLPEEHSPICVMVYATEKILKGYVPQVGDSVRGVGWLQGVPEKEIPIEGIPWMDSVQAENAEDNLEDQPEE